MDLIDEIRCKEMRKKIFLAAYHNGTSHIASCYSCLEILYTLYCKNILRIDRNKPTDKSRDRFLLSKGHAGLGLYAVLIEAGLLDSDILKQYLKPEYRIGGEPVLGEIPFVEASTGSLGHGLSIAVGMALSQKIDKLDARTYILLGDGECQEGSIWEAAMSADRYNLDNLVAILDYNGLQKMGKLDELMGTVDWRRKWESFGWYVDEADGHDIEALAAKLEGYESNGKPYCLIAHTIKGKGVSAIENHPLWHFKNPSKKEVKVFVRELSIIEQELE